MNKPVYLDYMATTPVDPAVTQIMHRYLGPNGDFGNPASKTHVYGDKANQAVEWARQEVAGLIGCDSQSLVWTSGATESNNLAIQGACRFYKRKGSHIITTAIEHKAVLDVLSYLERDGFEIEYLQPDSSGVIRPEQVERAIRQDTLLVSVMHVNNELGTVNDIATLASLAKQKGALVHVDAAQSPGKADINLAEWPIDLLSLSAHKFYGPKGVGALFVRQNPRIRLEPLCYGGGHEKGLRPGTVPTHQVVGMGEAARQLRLQSDEERSRVSRLRDDLYHELTSLGGVRINGLHAERVPHCLNVAFEGVDGEALLYALADIAVSTGSACTSATLEPSHVLRAIGLPARLADASIRISLGRFVEGQDMEFVGEHIRSRVEWLRSISGYR